MLAAVVRWVAVVCLVGGLGACATTQAQSSDAEAMAAGMAGVYDNAVQWSGLAETFRAESGLRPVEVRFVVVRPQRLNRVGVYEEWRGADAGRPVVRQRLWLFAPDGADVRVDRYTLQQPSRFLGAGADAFLTISETDLTPLGPGCALRARVPDPQAWDARSQSRACRLTGERNSVETRVTRVPTGLLYSESASDRETLAAPFDLQKR